MFTQRMLLGLRRSEVVIFDSLRKNLERTMNTATEKGPHTDPIAVSCPVKTDLETQEVN